VDLAHEVGFDQVMILFVCVGKCLFDLAINPVPVASNLGIKPSLERTQIVCKGLAPGVVRTFIAIFHQHLADFRQRVPVILAIVLVLEPHPGLMIAKMGTPAWPFGQQLMHIGSHSRLLLIAKL
jgi:hypothetical protein